MTGVHLSLFLQDKATAWLFFSGHKKVIPPSYLGERTLKEKQSWDWVFSDINPMSLQWGTVPTRQGLIRLPGSLLDSQADVCLCLFVVGREWKFLKVHWPYLQTLNASHDLGHQTTSGLYFYPSRFVSRCEVGFFPLAEHSSLGGRNRVPGCSWGWLDTKTTLFVFRGLKTWHKAMLQTPASTWWRNLVRNSLHLGFVFL